MTADIVAPLKFTAKLACVQVLLDIGGGQGHSESQGHKETAKKFLKQLETGCYTAVSEKLLKRLVFMYPEKLTNQLLVALVPSHIRELTLKSCEGLSSEGLKEVVSRCPHLSRLDLTRCQQFSSPLVFTMITYYRPNITAVSLEHCENLCDNSVKILLQNLKSLKHLNVSSCTSLTDKVFLINEDLQLSKECDLNVTHNSEDYECSLVSVDISCTTLSSVAVRHLTTLSGPTLQNINLSWTGMDALALLYLSGYSIAAVADIALASSSSLDSELVESLKELKRTLLQLKLKNQSENSCHLSDATTDKQDNDNCDKPYEDFSNTEKLKFVSETRNTAEDGDELANEMDDDVKMKTNEEVMMKSDNNDVEIKHTEVKVCENQISQLTCKQGIKDDDVDDDDGDDDDFEKKGLTAQYDMLHTDEVMCVEWGNTECTDSNRQVGSLSTMTCKTHVSDSAAKHWPDNYQSDTSHNTSDLPYVFHRVKEFYDQSEHSNISFSDKNQSSSDPNQLYSDHFFSVSPLHIASKHIPDSCQTNGVYSHTDSVQQNLKFEEDTAEKDTTFIDLELKDDTEFAVCQNSSARQRSEDPCSVEQKQTSKSKADLEIDCTTTPDSGVCLTPGSQCVQVNSDVSKNQYTDDTTLNNLSVCDRSNELTNKNQVAEKYLGENDLSVCDQSNLTSQKCENLSLESVDKTMEQPSLLNNRSEVSNENGVFLETHSVSNEKGTFKSDYGIILSNNSEEIMKSCDFEETSEKSPPIGSSERKSRGKFYKPNIVSLSIENLSCQNSYGIDIYKCLRLFAKENPGLKKLIVSGTEILDNKSLWKLSKHWPSLRELRLNECENLTHEGISALGTHCKHLSIVYLYGVNFVHDPAVFCFLKNKNIEILNLAECAITDKTLKRIADFNMDKLKALNLSWCDDLTEDGLNCVCSRQSDTLYKLSFRQLPVSNTTLDLIATNLQHLKIVNLSSVGSVDDPALINLMKHLPLLENIDISWNSDITDNTIFALMINCPRLQVAVLAGLKRLTSAPFLPMISDIKQWRRCQALLQFKLGERKIKEEMDLGSSSDEEYNDLFLPHRSTVYSPDLKTLNLEYCDCVADRDLNEISFICRQSITITNYYGEIVKPELTYNTRWYSNYLDL